VAQAGGAIDQTLSGVPNAFQLNSKTAC